MKTKMSSEQVGQILGQVGPTLRAQQEKIASLKTENDELLQKIARYERRERAEKLAALMESKGLDPDKSFSEKVETLSAPDTDLDVVEKAINMSAQQVKLASLSDNPGNPSDATNAFHLAILGD